MMRKQIVKWIHREYPRGPLPEVGTCAVSIEKEAYLPFSTCHLRIQLGATIWESRETGKTAEQALAHAIEHLHSRWRRGGAFVSNDSTLQQPDFAA
jgi:hypothetical protein